MKSETITVEQLFQNRRQYCVPFYQRAYVWTLEDQWEQLWEDIRSKAEARVAGGKFTPHFLGAVVLDPQHRDGLIGVEAYHIIDGQQPLTTLQYVLTSALFALNSLGNGALSPIVTGCLKNGNPETMRNAAIETFKVWPTFRDRLSYRAGLTAVDLNELAQRFDQHFTQAGELRKIGMEHPPALAALWYFTHQFQAWLSEPEPQPGVSRAEALVIAILRDLKLVSIVLDTDDDAQIIFETLNGRGAQLHATDLIRNYVFMRADRDQADSEALYNNLWSAFESAYWSEEQRRGRLKKPRLEWLLHSTLQAELHEDVDLARIYHEYRRFATSTEHPRTAEQQLLTLSSYADHYKELVSGTGAMPIAGFGRRIAAYDITTLYPLALMISTSAASDNEKAEMFTDLVSFLVRRAACGLTSKNYNNVFQGLLKQLHAAGIKPAALRSLLVASTGDVSRWPDDAEFRNACLTASLYPGRLDSGKMKGMLSELERGLRSESRPEEAFLGGLDALDVDHILPQSWYAHWPLQDGSSVTWEEASEVEVLSRSGFTMNERQQNIVLREAAYRNLGNLTLLNLSVNRQAQHYAFKEKRDLLIANTNLRLNIPLVSRTEWNEAAIAERGQQLTTIALRLWPGPRA
ncbi:DUF262 domain-containing protein [Acidobacteria bacterium AB60]|nr:DUF262 domain-containing protein [Acidobacteria bacterium AB60]